MSSYRTEISIPVNKDSRTLEERRQNVFSALEEKYARPNIVENSKLNSRDRQNLTRMNHDSFFDKDKFFKSNFDNWDSDVSEWIQNSRKRWDDEMERVRRSMFTLDSDRDEMDFNSWDPFRSMKRFNDERDIEFQRQQKIATCSEGIKRMRESLNNIMTPSINDNEKQYPVEDSYRNFYEFDQDGELHFKIRFDAKKFKPEEIKVTCSDNKLNIIVQKSETDSVELHKSIVIPNSIDSQKFQCHITQDGILILEAPVKSPDYCSVVPKEQMFRDAYKPQMVDRNQVVVNRIDNNKNNKTGPIILNDDNGKRLHLEIPVEGEYVPGDFSVTTEMNRITVKGRHEIKTPNSSSFKEFSQYYEIPDSIDPMSVNFSVTGGKLIIEALVH